MLAKGENVAKDDFGAVVFETLLSNWLLFHLSSTASFCCSLAVYWCLFD